MDDLAVLLTLTVTPQTSTTPSSSFGDQVVELCRFLQQWHKEEELLLESDPNEPPETKWRVLAQALFFLGAGGLVLFVQTWVRFVEGYATLSLFLVLVAVCSGAAAVLALHAYGIFEGRFWYAIWRSITTDNKFPFTPLIRRTERDVAALPRLAQFSNDVLRTTEERLSASETRFQEGLTLLGGNSSLPALAAFVVGAWGAWESFSGDASVLSMIALAGAVGVLWMAAYTFNLRFSLFELTRCRGLIALELARRRAEDKPSAA